MLPATESSLNTSESGCKQVSAQPMKAPIRERTETLLIHESSCLIVVYAGVHIDMLASDLAGFTESA